METQLPTPAPMTSRLPQYRSERERQNIRSALRLVSVTLAARWALPLSRFSTCTAPISLHSQCAFIVYPVSNALDRLYFQFCPCVCVCLPYALNDHVGRSLSIFTKFCMHIRNAVGSKPVVCGTNRR